MKTEEVKKLSPLDRFTYWIRERHQIHLRRRAGKPKPWTDDEVLQSTFFTNPYRENDKVTVWFRENVREPLRNDPRVLMATVIFRWFNLPDPTGRILSSPRVNAHTNFKAMTQLDRLGRSLVGEWDGQEALRLLKLVREEGGKIFTGAFMINSPGGEPKLEAIIRRIDNVWKEREWILEEILDCRNYPNGEVCSLEKAHNLLTKYEGLGGFMAYEVVCDLRYTYLLEHAPDKLTWCNPGPGAVRGLYRVLERPFPKGNNASSPPVPKDWTEKTQWLLAETTRRLPKMPPFEMREIEMSLCEVDKYERILWGDGKAKRTYNGK